MSSSDLPWVTIPSQRAAGGLLWCGERQGCGWTSQRQRTGWELWLYLEAQLEPRLSQLWWGGVDSYTRTMPDLVGKTDHE